MRCVGIVAGWLLSCVLFSFLLEPLPLCAADQQPAASDRELLQQQSSGEAGRRLNRQVHPDSSTLELAPQPQAAAPSPVATPDEAARSYRPHDDVAINKNAESEQPDHEHRAHLGVQLEYTSQCLLGEEMHGFEVVTVWPNSPAERAGLQARKSGTPLGDLQVIGSLLAFPVALFTVPRIRRSGALGMPGDLVVAVNDRRVRTKRELMRELDALRPGDTVYLTVIRAVVGGGHQTLRIALHTDEILDPSQASSAP